MRKHLTLCFMMLLCASWLPAQEAVAQDDATARRELESQYAKLIEAHYRKDLKAIVALKTADFHTIGPDERVNDSRTMEEYSRRFLESNKPPWTIRMTIQRLTVSEHRSIAVAVIFQEVTRFQELAGKRRKVETSVIQRETWVKTPDGWKLKVVDDVHDQRRFVDGKRVDPSKPFDPEAPAYQPEKAENGKAPR